MYFIDTRIAKVRIKDQLIPASTEINLTNY